MNEFAQELQKRGAPTPGQAIEQPQIEASPQPTQQPTPQQPTPQQPTQPSKEAKKARDNETHRVFQDDVLIPSQIRETYKNNGPPKSD